jgi:hypothetical protein
MVDQRAGPTTSHCSSLKRLISLNETARNFDDLGDGFLIQAENVFDPPDCSEARRSLPASRTGTVQRISKPPFGVGAV